MPDNTERKSLFIVPQNRRLNISAQDFVEPGTQGILFPVPKRGLILFMLFPDVNEQEFCDALKSSMPSYVIELRTSPRFDIGGLNRQDAFHVFKAQNIIYCDITSAAMEEVHVDGVLVHLKEFLRQARVNFDKPIVFLVDRADTGHNLVARVMQTLCEYSPEPKYIFEVPHFEEEPQVQSLMSL